MCTECNTDCGNSCEVIEKEINPSIAGIVHLCQPIGFKESVQIFYDREEGNWEGVFIVEIHESKLKEIFFPIEGNLIKSGKKLTWIISPQTQNLPVGSYYYEIFSITARRVYFKGNFKISR